MSRSRYRILAVPLIMLVTALTIIPASAEIAVVETALVSVTGGGVQGNDESLDPAISGDGSTIVFSSQASNLALGDSNGDSDIFAHEIASGTTTLISAATGGTQGNFGSIDPAVSADGSVIAYFSAASNLIPSDTNDTFDVFVHDVAAGTTRLVSAATGGVQGNDFSQDPAISADGSTITFASASTNLVPGDTNGAWDVFMYDVATAATTRISVDSGGIQGNDESGSAMINADGSIITYHSEATNLVAGDTNGQQDIFMYDVATATTTRISVADDGTQADAGCLFPSITADATTVVYQSTAGNLVAGDTNALHDIFMYDVAAATTTRVSVADDGTQGDGSSSAAAIAADGSTIAYRSAATNLVAGDTNGQPDVFAYDVATATTTRVSVATDGSEANGDNLWPAITANGGTIVYHSKASNLTAGDVNGFADVFVTTVNRAPLAVGFSATVAEDVVIGTSLGTVSYNDSDGDPVSFSIVAGNGAGLFSIGATNGVVATAGTLDYETAMSHDLTIAVSDGTLVGSAAITIAVTDVYEVDPAYDPFTDDDASIFEADIEWLAYHRITAGCGPLQFCPADNVTRGQMAAFLTRALDLAPAERDYFTDDETSIFEDAINRLAQAGITRGCSAATFCPDDPVTRGEVAAFLVRALGLTDAGTGDLFDDDDHSIFEASIDRLATAGITKGCNPPDNTRFCPEDNVTRGQISAFLHRALGD
ncbi:MAG: hypothetical protein GY722_22385 [bacterium]|nr:hypothetical protein [bacterium]